MAAGIQVASLYAKLSADVSQFDRAMRQADGALGKTSAALGTFTKIGIGAAVAGLGAVTTGMYQALKASSAFDKTVSGAAAVLNATSEEMAKLDKLALQLGKDTQFSATEAASAIEMLGQNGLNATQILGGAATATVDLAAAAGTDLTTAADVASTAMTLFGIEADKMGQAVDGISGVTNASRFAIGDYAMALAAGGSAASQLGVTFDDFNAAIAATASSFSGGSDAGTSFKTFLQRLVPVSEPAAEAMKKLGLMTADGGTAFFDAAGKLKSFDQIAGILQKSMSGLSDEMKTELLFQAFGTDAARMALALGKIGAEGVTAARGIIDSTSAAEQARIRMDNLAGDVEQASGSFDTLKVMLGKAFTPLARRGVQGIASFFDRLIEIDFTPLVRRVEAIAYAISQAFSGTGNLFERLGKLGGMDVADALLEVASIFGDWANGLWKLVRPLLLRFWSSLAVWITDPVRRSKILAALARHWNAFISWAGGLWTNIRPALNAMWQALTTWSTDPLKKSQLTLHGMALVQGLWKWATGLWGIISPSLLTWWGELTKWVTDAKKRDELLGLAEDLFSALWEWAGWLWAGDDGSGGIKALLGTMWGNLTSWVTNEEKRTQLLEAITSAWTSFVDWAGKVWDAVSPVLGDLWTSLTSWVTVPEKRQQLLEALQTAWTSFVDWAAWLWSVVGPALGGLWTSLTSWVTVPEKRQQLFDALTSAWTSFTDWAAWIWSVVSPVLGTLWTSLTGWVTDEEKRKQLFEAIKTSWTSFTDWAGKVWEWAEPKLIKFWQDLTSWVTDPTKRSQLLSKLQTAWDSFTSWAGWLWSVVSPVLGGMWTSLTSWVTNPVKRTELFDAISTAWTSFTDWASNLWNGTPENPGGIKGKLNELWGNLNTWIDENVPVLGPWIDEFTGFITGVSTTWNEEFPKMSASFVGLKDTLVREAPLIAEAFDNLRRVLFGGDDPLTGEAFGDNLVRSIAVFVTFVSEALSSLITQFRTYTDIIALTVEMLQALFSMDFGRFNELRQRRQSIIEEYQQAGGGFRQALLNLLGESFDIREGSLADWLINGNSPTGNTGGGGGGASGGGGTSGQNYPPSIASPVTGGTYEGTNGSLWQWSGTGWTQISGFAKGGRVPRSGSYLVGEEGPELVTMSGGSYVNTAEQTAAMLGGQNLHITLDVRGESSLPTDRAKLQELARALMGELRLRGFMVSAT